MAVRVVLTMTASFMANILSCEEKPPFYCIPSQTLVLTYPKAGRYYFGRCIGFGTFATDISRHDILTFRIGGNIRRLVLPLFSVQPLERITYEKLIITAALTAAALVSAPAMANTALAQEEQLPGLPLR